jgi:hypothetical protein
MIPIEEFFDLAFQKEEFAKLTSGESRKGMLYAIWEIL